MKNDRFVEEKYGLKENPFLDDIAREVWLQTWVNREEQLEVWTKIISNAVSSNKNHIAFVIGDYGRGKTLSLLKIVSEAEKYKEIYPAYLNFKGEEKSKQPGLDFIFRIFKNVNFDEIGKDKGKEELENAIESLPDVLDEVKIILNKIYFGGKEQKLALYFLRGEIRPTQSQLKELNVLRKIESIDIAKEYLAGMLGFIKRVGYTTVLLAIDEFEYLFSLISKAQHSIYLALLRGLYDFPLGMGKDIVDIANMVFFIAVSEDGWRNLKEMEKKEASSGGPIQPLLDRVDAETTLGVFDKKQTRELIEEKLRYNRIKGKYEVEPLIPFTEDFVDFIYEKTGGALRAIIVRCGQVLDVGLAEKAPLLSKEFARKALEERGF